MNCWAWLSDKGLDTLLSRRSLPSKSPYTCTEKKKTPYVNGTKEAQIISKKYISYVNREVKNIAKKRCIQKIITKTVRKISPPTSKKIPRCCFFKNKNIPKIILRVLGCFTTLLLRTNSCC
jgi:hypothetical protein